MFGNQQNNNQPNASSNGLFAGNQSITGTNNNVTNNELFGGSNNILGNTNQNTGIFNTGIINNQNPTNTVNQ